MSKIHDRKVESLHVLFVCTGNICRSPTAERLATAWGHHIPDLVASSAGLRAVVGHPIQDEAAAVLQELKGDASNFAARQLTTRIASSADLILTMTLAQRDAVMVLAPRQFRRTFTLTEAAALISMLNARTLTDLSTLRPHLAARELVNIPDPIGKEPEFFGRVAAQIADLVPSILELCQRDSDSPVD